MDSGLWGHSADWWNGAMLLSLGLAAFVASLVALATGGAIVSSKREAVAAKAELDLFKAETAGKVAQANSEGIAAGRAAADANARAAEANERAAKAELELAKYRAGRSVSHEQKRQMEEVLRSAPKGPVIIKPNFLSPEPTRYATELSDVFNHSGFSNVGDKALEVVSTNLPGLFLVIRDKKHVPPQTAAIMEAFRAAGIPITAHQETYVPDVDTVVILVGERP